MNSFSSDIFICQCFRGLNILFFCPKWSVQEQSLLCFLRHLWLKCNFKAKLLSWSFANLWRLNFSDLTQTLQNAESCIWFIWMFSQSLSVAVQKSWQVIYSDAAFCVVCNKPNFCTYVKVILKKKCSRVNLFWEFPVWGRARTSLLLLTTYVGIGVLLL